MRTPLLLSVGLGLLAAPAAAQAATKVVYAGNPPTSAFRSLPRGAEANAFFSSSTTVHVGDSVRWKLNGFHNVLFPKVGDAPPPFAGVDPTTPISGVQDARGRPFWFNGQPRLILDPRTALPTGGDAYDGSALTGSGLPPEQPPRPDYQLRFSKAGSFTYFCTVHPGMAGQVVVKPVGQTIPSPAQHARLARAQAARNAARLRAALAAKPARGNVVEAGRDTIATALLKFFPARKAIRVGETVTFTMPRSSSETHMVTFGPRAYLDGITKGFITPTPGPTPGPPSLVVSPREFLPSDPLPLKPYTGREHGNGFLNSGALDSNPSPFPSRVRIRFVRVGSFRYVCLIHPGMEGRIVVRPRARFAG